MARNLKEIEQEIMQLSSKDRASLMERLIGALDTEVEGDVEELWLREAEQRYEAYRQGQLKPRSACQVFDGNFELSGTFSE